jgi:glutamate-1-semialdehyde 2,1-aminomutase
VSDGDEPLGWARSSAGADSAPTSAELFERARRVVPGGVSSPVRAFTSVGGSPRFISRAAGARVTTADGEELLDYVGSWGPLILGHANPGVVEAARSAVARGSSYGAPTEDEVALCEEVAERVPGVEQVRLVNSGTEAGMSAVRVARAFTGRDVVVKFAGHYHGHSDALLASAGSGVATFGLPDSPGVTEGAARDTLVLPWNDFDAVEQAFAERGHEIALVACEPVGANMGVVPPRPGFLERLRALTRAHGALLLFDEVMTGFRVARGGMAERSGITPDLAMFAKVLGGGFPLAAFAGRRDVMSLLAPEGPVYQSGTLSGNPVAVAAGLAQLRQLDADAYARLEALAERLIDGLANALRDAGVGATIQRAGSLLSVFFRDDAQVLVRGLGADEPEPAVASFADAQGCDHQRFAAFFQGMLERGIYLPPSGFEAIFVSLAHTELDVEATVDAARETLAGLR